MGWPEPPHFFCLQHQIKIKYGKHFLGYKMSNRLKNISFGVMPQENAGMHKIAKMLLTTPLNRDQIKMQALKYLITPHQLAQRQVNKYGWMSVVPKHLLNNIARQELALEISEIEKDTSISAYDRVGKIVKAIKSKTNAPFLRDSAFRTMMNTKHNEYVLHDNIHDIHSVEDALRILREADVAAKRTTFAGAFPELLHENRLTNHSTTPLTNIWLGGQTHQHGLELITEYIKSLWKIRTLKLRKSDKIDQPAMIRALDVAWVGRDDAKNAGKACLELLRKHMPEKVRHIPNDFVAGLDENEGSFAGIKDIEHIKSFILTAYQDKTRLSGYLNNPLAIKAAKEMLASGNVKNAFEKGQYLDFNKWIASQFDYDTARTSVMRRDELLNIIKSLKVDSASSYDTTLANMARYDFKTRQPMIFAIDKILGIDNTIDDSAWRREASIALKGSSSSLFPSNLSHMTPNEAVRSETLEAVSRTMGGKVDSGTLDDKEEAAKLWFAPGGRGAFFTPSGMPTIIGLPSGVNDEKSKSLNNQSSFDMWSGTGRKIRFREALLQYTQKDYEAFRARHLPKNTPPMIGSKKVIPSIPLTTAKFDTLTLAALRFGPRALGTQAQGFVQYLKTNFTQAKTNETIKTVETMAFSKEDINTPNGLGNNAMHDALKLEATEQNYERVRLGYLLTEAFEKAGGSYAAVNFYGVPLTELIPMAVGGDTNIERHTERTRLARANAMSENLQKALGDTEDNVPAPQNAGFSL
jgi:hypothetical protein